MPNSKPDIVTAAEMAREAGIEPKHFRKHLRRAGLAWHKDDRPWRGPRGGAEHEDLKRVLAAVLEKRAAAKAE